MHRERLLWAQSERGDERKWTWRDRLGWVTGFCTLWAPANTWSDLLLRKATPGVMWNALRFRNAELRYGPDAVMGKQDVLRFSARLNLIMRPFLQEKS